jgi:hypothetical protein
VAGQSGSIKADLVFWVGFLNSSGDYYWNLNNRAYIVELADSRAALSFGFTCINPNDGSAAAQEDSMQGVGNRSRVSFMAAVLGVLAATGAAQAATLTPGDISMIGFQFDPDDGGAFVALTGIPGNTTIHFTDQGWTNAGGGGFIIGENTLTWRAPSGGIAAGTVVQVPFLFGGLSNSGDQILAFQGPANAPTFISAVHSDGATWQASATTNNQSELPSGLNASSTGVAIPEVDNGSFRLNTLASGTKAQWLSAFANPANWDTGNDPIGLPTGAITVTGAAAPGPDLQTAPGNVIITEIMYNPAGALGAKPEWVEITNVGAATADVGNWYLINGAGVSAAVPAGTTLAPGASLVLSLDTLTSDFLASWDPNGTRNIGVDAVGSNMALDNALETLELADPNGLPVDAVNYFDGLNGWPAENGMASIYLLPGGMSGDGNDLGANWALSAAGVDGAYESTTTAAFGGPNVGSPGLVVVPEPASLGMLGLVGLLAMRKRR